MIGRGWLQKDHVKMRTFLKFDLNSKIHSHNGSIQDAILEEIALEGLDGITFDGLIIRLEQRKDIKLSLKTDQEKNFILQVVQNLLRDQCASSKKVQAFQLQEPRIPLVIYDLFQFEDSDCGVCVEPDDLPDDPYPFGLVDQTETGVKGSCVAFHTRKNVTKEFKNINHSKDFDAKFCPKSIVFVASQDLRARTILGSNYDPILARDLTAMQWAILERIGRARQQGEMTHGKLSLNFTKESPKTLFYHRKVLVSKNLLTKQVQYIKIKNQNFQSLLLHLPRFFVERHSRSLKLTQSIVRYLKPKPLCAASYEEISAVFGPVQYKKLYKNSEFRKFIHSDIKMSVRTLYPDAHDADAKCKGTGKEKTLRCVQLIDPSIDPDVVLQGAKEEDGSEDEEDDTQETNDKAGWLIDRTIHYQAFQFIVESGSSGLTQTELARKMGVTSLDARCFVRNLQRLGVVSNFLRDMGRQRTTFYIAQRFQNLNIDTAQVEIEKKKMEELLKIKDCSNSMEEERLEEDQDSHHDISFESKDEIKIEVSKDFPNKMILPTTKNTKKKTFDSSENSQSVRRLRRSNTILEAVRTYKVIDGASKLYQTISANEREEGLDAKMDRKSMLRILNSLAEEKQIRNIRVKLQLGDKVKDMLFICDTDIDENHTIIKSAVEQAKMKMNIVPKDKSSLEKSLRVKQEQSDESFDQSLHESDNPPRRSGLREKVTFGKCDGKKYGLQPKFIRMQEFHTVLFYLCRCYDGQLRDSKEFIAQRKRQGQTLSAEFEQELESMELYQTEIDWKMFIPPLPVHQDWGNGWSLMCDVLLRLPLSIFVKIINVTVEINGLHEYLDHPIRKHYLVKSLPTYFRDGLLFHRKYIFSTTELANRLAFIGVLQMGPQKLKEKDQVFLYVNQNASLFDTVSSSKGYHQVEKKDYPKLIYRFENLNDVLKYWYDMHEICFYTPLGGSQSMLGKEITLEVMDKKTELLAALEPRTNREAAERDSGFIPGDNLGSAGLDSSMFSHLKRNWSVQSANKDKVENASKPRVDSLIPRKRLNKEKLVTLEPNVKRPKGKSFPKPVVKGSKEPEKSLKYVPAIKRSRPKSVRRVITKRSVSRPRMPYYDEIDKRALKLMRKLRVDWTDEEDRFLLLSKVAGGFLCQNLHIPMVNHGWVRDQLHCRFPHTSMNKTSRAVQRRLYYMLKNPSTSANVTLFMEDLRQDLKILNMVTLPTRGSLTSEESRDKLKADFDKLIEFVVNKYKHMNKMSDILELPDSIDELIEKYAFVQPSETIVDRTKFREPQNEEDVTVSVIHSLIISSLSTHLDKTDWNPRMFKIYQQYPDQLLRSTYANIRSAKMVSLKKMSDRLRVKAGRCPLYSTTVYQLSVNFMHKLLAKYHHEIYTQSWQLIKRLAVEKVKVSEDSEGLDIIANHEGGFAAAVCALMARGRLSMQTVVPEQIVVLDPNLSSVDEQFVSILERSLLKKQDYLAMEDVDIGDIKKQKSNDFSKEVTIRTLLKQDKKQGAVKRKGDNDSEKSEPKKPRTEPFSPIKTRNDESRKSRTEFSPPSKSCPTFQEGVIFQEQTLLEENRGGVQVAKSASRLALYLMREDMRDEEDNLTVQHTHDYFVISACKISAKLKERVCKPASDSPDQQTRIELNDELVHVPSNLLVLETDTIDRILRRYGVKRPQRAAERNMRYLPSEPITLESYMESKTPEDDDSILTEIYSIISDAGMLGVTGAELQSKTSHLNSVVRVVQKMIDSLIVYRTGIVSPRFVCSIHAKPWVLHSFTVSKKEAIPTMHASLSAEMVERRTKDKADLSSSDRKISSFSSIENIDIVDFIIRPWIKIDGSLNRRVLDRLLGSILGNAMHRPGQRLSKLAERISPAMMPCHVRELVEILEDLGCVKLFKVEVALKPGLFSKIKLPSLTRATILDDSSLLVVEVSVDAIVKLGQFIGDKQYSTNVYDCPCHPV